MPIKRVDGGWKASYAGRTATFKTKSAAEKWASKYTGKKKEVVKVKRTRKGRTVPTRRGVGQDRYV